MSFVPLLLGEACLGVLAVSLSGAQDKAKVGDEKTKTSPPAWGKPVNGLQAGIRVKPSEPQPRSVMELQVVIRNVGKQKAGFGYELALYFWGAHCTIRIRIWWLRAAGAFWQHDLEAGEEYTIGS